MLVKPILPLLLLFALGGCAHSPGGSVAGGECKFLERPPYAVKGKQAYDQDWIDSTIEGGVGACQWQRPAARPAELDTPKKAPAKVVKKKKPAWLGFLPRPRPKAAPVAVEPLTVLPAEPAAPAPRSAIDELLGSIPK